MIKKRCEILPFRGFGTESAVRASGRVLERRARTSGSGIGAKLRALHDRFETDEIAGAVVVVTTPHGDTEVVTDEEGHFQVLLGLPTPFPGRGPWHTLKLSLKDDPSIRTTVDVIVPTDARRGIISDIDDTIVSTKAYHPIAKLKRTFLTDARKRVPFPGVPELYQRLVGGKNPIFYVSSSPWNLHEVFCEAFDLYGVPRGPLFFKDFGLAPGKFVKTSHDEHKLGWCGVVMDTYPELPFLLFGDTGQRDALIYAELARHYPGRVTGVYLREVIKCTDEVNEGLAQLRALGVEAKTFVDTRELSRLT